MPWTCKACHIEVSEDDATCPQCAQAKTTWTVVQDRTRTFRLSGQRGFVLLREETVAERAPAINVDRARRLAESGEPPLPGEVLTVRLHPGSKTDWTLELAVDLETEETAELTLPRNAPPDHPQGVHADIHLLLVYGAEAAERRVLELTLPGIDHVVDITDEPGGRAPFLEVRALSKPMQRVPVGDIFFIRAQLLDRTGWSPAAQLACEVAGRSTYTDADGILSLDEVDLGAHRVVLEDGEVLVAAVHYPGLLTPVRLPFYEATGMDAFVGIEGVYLPMEEDFEESDAGRDDDADLLDWFPVDEEEPTWEEDEELEEEFALGCACDGIEEELEDMSALLE